AWAALHAGVTPTARLAALTVFKKERRFITLLYTYFPAVTLTKFTVGALPQGDFRRNQPVNARYVVTLSRSSFPSRSPPRCTCGLEGHAIQLSLSNAWRKRRSTSSDLCGLHESRADRSQCHRVVRGIPLWTTSFRDRCEATFQIPFRATESDQIYRAL